MDLRAYEVEQFPIKVADSVRRIIDNGVIYVSGRDRFYRPIYITRVSKLQALDPQPSDEDVVNVLIIMFEYLKKYMHVPGHIENLLFLIDCENLSYSKVSFSGLKQILKALQT